MSNFLLPGDQPSQNNNAKTKNAPNPDFLRPVGNDTRNFTYADSYYMGLVGGRVADHEDDVTGLEGLGHNVFDSSYKVKDGLYFFTLDRGSPSGHLGEILVAREDMPGQFRVFTTPAQLGLNNTDNIDGLCVQLLGDLGADGWPVYDPARDLILFSVDRDSTGVAGSALRTESEQGEVPGDLFFASVSPGNMLFLEATDLGLQEFALGTSRNWLSDNLDAIDIPDLVPEPTFGATFAAVMLACVISRKKRGRRRAR
jgi:hypothetical protein